MSKINEVSVLLILYIRYIRDLTKSEIQSLIHSSKQNLQVALDHKYEYLSYNSAYLLKENSENDLNPTIDELRDTSVTHECEEGDRGKNNI